MSGTVVLKPLQAKLEKNKEVLSQIDPYCVAVIGEQQVVGHTSKNSGICPFWDDSFQMKCTNESYCYLEIKDKNSSKEKSLGICAVDLSELVKEGSLQKWYGLYCDRRPAGEILVSATFIPFNAFNEQAVQPSLKTPLKELMYTKTKNIDLFGQAPNSNRTKEGKLEGAYGGSGWKENRDPNKAINSYHRRGNSLGKPGSYYGQNNADFFSQGAVKNVQYKPEKDILLSALPEAGLTFKIEGNQYSNTPTLSENIGSLGATRSDLKDLPVDDQKEMSKANDTQTTLADIVNALESKPATLEEKLKDYQPSRNQYPKSSFKPSEIDKEILNEEKKLEEILIRTRGIDEVRASREDEECNILLQSTQLIPNEIAAKEGIHQLPASSTVHASHRRFSEDYSNQSTKPQPQPQPKPATSIITIKVSDIKSKFLDNVKKGTLMLRDGFNNFTSKKESSSKGNLFNSHAPYLEHNGGNSNIVHNSPTRLRTTETKQKFTVDVEQLKEISKGGALARLEEKVTDKLHNKETENVGTTVPHSKPSTIDTVEPGQAAIVNTERSKHAPTHRLVYSGAKHVEEMPLQIQNHFRMYNDNEHENLGAVKYGPTVNAQNLTPSKADKMNDKANEPISPSKQASAEKLIHYKRVGAEEWTQGDSRNDRAFIDDPSSNQSDISKKEYTEEKDSFGGLFKENQKQCIFGNYVDSRSPLSKTETIKQKHFEGVHHERPAKSDHKKFYALNSARSDHHSSSKTNNNVNLFKQKFKEETDSNKPVKPKVLSERNRDTKSSGNHNVLKPAYDARLGLHTKAEASKPKAVKTIEQVKGKTAEKITKLSHNVSDKNEAKNKAHFVTDTKKINNTTLKQKFNEGLEQLKNKITATEKTPVNEPNHFIPITTILNDREKYHQGGLQWAKANNPLIDSLINQKNEGQEEDREKQTQMECPITNQIFSEEVRKRSSSFENGAFSDHLRISNKLGKTHEPMSLKQHENIAPEGRVKRRNLSIDMMNNFEPIVREQVVQQVEKPVHVVEVPIMERLSEIRESVGKENILREHNSGRKLSGENHYLGLTQREKGRRKSGQLPPLESKITKLMQEFFSELNKSNLETLEGHHGEEVKGKEGAIEQNTAENDENYNPNKVLASNRHHGEKVGIKPRAMKW